MADEQQQQQQQTPAIDYSTVYGTLSPENKAVYEKKAFNKGADGKPVDINAVFDWGRNAEKLVGAHSLADPNLADDAEFDKWAGHEKLGVPKDAKDYKFSFDKTKLAEGMEWDQAAEDMLRTEFLKAKIGNKQADRIFNALVAHRAGETTRSQQTNEEARKAFDTDLTTAFGAAREGEVTRAQMALRYAAEQSGVLKAGDTSPEGKAVLGAITDGFAKTLGNIGAVRVMNWLGRQLGEDKIKGGNSAGFKDSPAAAKAEIEQLKTDADFTKAYYEKSHAGHKAAVDRMNRLHQQAAQKTG